MPTSNTNILISPEVVAAFITFVLTCISGYVIYFITSRRGNRIVLANVGKTSLISASEKIGSSLKFIYKDKEIDKLYLYEFELYNAGNIDIKNIELRVHFGKYSSHNFIEVEREDKLEKLEVVINIIPGRIEEGGPSTALRLTRPFLNSLKRYPEEKLKIRVFTGSEMNIISVQGGGEGWYSSYKDESKNTTDDSFVDNFFRLPFVLISFISIVICIGIIFLFDILELDVFKYSIINLFLLPIIVMFFVTVIDIFFQKMLNKKPPRK